MCAIIGSLVWSSSGRLLQEMNNVLNSMFARSIERGRDGYGYSIIGTTMQDKGIRKDVRVPERRLAWETGHTFFDRGVKIGNLVANLRAEPTTEYVKTKQEADQQPYRVGPWVIAHNGTIANDAELRTYQLGTVIDSAAIAELLGVDHMLGRTDEQVARYFGQQIRKLKGSYAIIAHHEEHPEMMLVACNYRPIWVARLHNGLFFGSARQYMPQGVTPRMVPPYSAWAFTERGTLPLWLHDSTPKRALVVCSGGLDSVVAATAAKVAGIEIELVHFMYGSRAEGPEVKAVTAVAEALGVPCRLFPMPIYSPTDSPLLRADSTIAGGEEGAEFAHEWVPARNLVMLAIATALAEANGFDTIILGNNLEEAGAYPDNEPEFISRFNDMLPFAVADGKHVRVEMPVGNLMKHEIVDLGLQLGAPLDKTWSCYRAGEKHCGTCGPCYMRRKAFEINGKPEVIEYINKGIEE